MNPESCRNMPPNLTRIFPPLKAFCPIVNDGEVFNLRAEPGRRALRARMRPFIDRPCAGQSGPSCAGEPSVKHAR